MNTQITFDSQYLKLHILERKPLFDNEGNVMDYSNHRITLAPDEGERAKELGSEVEKAFNFFMTDEVQTEYAEKNI